MMAVHEGEERIAWRLPSHNAHARVEPPVADVPTRAWEHETGLLHASVSVDNDGDRQRVVLSIRGEIDLGTVPALLEALTPVLEHGDGEVVMDLSEVQFMDSTGVHVLLDVQRRLRSQNRRLAVACREHSQVHRLLSLVGLIDAMTVHRSRESAVLDGGEVIRSKPFTSDDAHQS